MFLCIPIKFGVSMWMAVSKSVQVLNNDGVFSDIVLIVVDPMRRNPTGPHVEFCTNSR